MTYRTDQSPDALAEWTARIDARIAAALQADHEQRIIIEWRADAERSRKRIAGDKQ